MKKIIIITSIMLATSLFLVTTSYGLAISFSSGSMTADWEQNGDVYNWTGYWFMNGADAASNQSDPSTSVSDYNSYANSRAEISPDLYGAAEVVTDDLYPVSVSSEAYASNNGTGYVQAASGTSHLRRYFTVEESGNYTFDATYLFDDLQSTTDSSETVWGYHHASLSIWDDLLPEGQRQISVTEAFSVGATNPLSGTLSISYDLIAATTYSYELHTYNSVTANSSVVSGTAQVPEPATMLLLGTGLVGLAGARFRKKKASE